MYVCMYDCESTDKSQVIILMSPNCSTCCLLVGCRIRTATTLVVAGWYFSKLVCSVILRSVMSTEISAFYNIRFSSIRHIFCPYQYVLLLFSLIGNTRRPMFA
jgi:hypothetical protein